MAALVIAGCTWALGGDGMEAWGWRLPFLLSGAVAPVAAGFLGRELCGDSDDERVEEEYRLAAGLSEKTDGKPSAKKRKISASKGNTKNKRAATKEESNDGTGSNPLELLMNTAADQKRKA